MLRENVVDNGIPSPDAKRMRETAQNSLSYVRPVPFWQRITLYLRGRRDAKLGILTPLPDGSYETPALRRLQAQALEDISLVWIQASDYVGAYIDPMLRHLESVYLDENNAAEALLATKEAVGAAALQRDWPGDVGEDPALVQNRKQNRAASAIEALAKKANEHRKKADDERKKALESGLLAEYKNRVVTSKNKQKVHYQRYHERACIYLEAGRVSYERGACDIPDERQNEAQKLFYEHFPPYQFDLKENEEA